ncbi:magnesium chelatase family protein [Marinitoga hydrogenitolerans DSM 16785]|uniref:Magnesium chelatase family protein n=1 Tax=Marinitoga hydrogenitolerans (strain DSM 16785 / JCM 12826 / AT1271) TaxID=1122195 RepID=A0A1M4ZFJ2_MARH1|nr:YifB family Mg chelatase-like AAA ATPase [Marinitoga hydrogenitolerans]SHF16728.1 magnesium chelatase family protein [Marinitoga hydrogenitolerans DSM 16785]
MKYSKVNSAYVSGFEVKPIIVEVDINSKATQQIFKIVGMPSTAILESQKRVFSAIRNSGFTFPNGNVTVNLAPSNIKKQGTHFDLPIAVSILLASKQLNFDINNYYIFGEIGLNGEIRGVPGITLLLLDIANKNKNTKFIIPKENEEEAVFIKNNDVFVIEKLIDIINIFNIEKNKMYKANPKKIEYEKVESSLNFSEIKGQYFAKRAAEIAAAGFHNLLMTGSPGSGKTMIARRIPTILPEMTHEEMIESTKIYSIYGFLNKVINKRPFRSPHHSASTASIIGGGADSKPGEVSLANNGILFLDEFPEFRTDVIESLRQPLEDGFVTISRAKLIATYPAKFMLVAAQNPCPCGYYSDNEHECSCSLNQILNYNKKVSGPIYDRIDIRIKVPRVKIDEMFVSSSEETSQAIKKRVEKASLIQIKRQGKLNGKLDQKEIKKYIKLDSKVESFLKNGAKKFKMTGRGINRILKISRTIADLKGLEKITIEDIAEAFQFRGDNNI